MSEHKRGWILPVVAVLVLLLMVAFMAGYFNKRSSRDWKRPRLWTVPARYRRTRKNCR